MASNEKRDKALEVTGFDTQNGKCTVSEKDAGNEQAIRGGSGTSMINSGKIPGGDFSPSGAANGYPSNK